MARKPQKRITLTDVAREAGVSRTTAAKVLLGTGGAHVRVGKAATERVRKAARTLTYQPNRAAQQLRGASTHMLGVLMDTVNAPVMNDRLAAVEKEAAGRGYRLLIGQVHGDTRLLADYLGDFDSRGVDAVLCLFDLTAGRSARLDPLLGGRHNIVYHGRGLRPADACVTVDTDAAVRMLIDHLVAEGRMRIGMELWNMEDELMTLRRTAYVEAMRAKGLKFVDELVWAAQSASVTPHPDALRTAVDRLVLEARADAIIASNDNWAARLVQTLKGRGIRVPQDVAVTGYDNLELADIIDPPLTTIDQEHRRYAQAALDLLTSLASDSPPPAGSRTRVIQPTLVVRASG